MKNFHAEMIEKAKIAKTAEELYEIAKANGVEITADEAKTYFEQMNPQCRTLDDDELSNVSGGACAGDRVRITSGETCKKCGGNIGERYSGHSGESIRCEKCKTYITYTKSCTYEIIG